jgi:hypothetical protein
MKVLIVVQMATAGCTKAEIMKVVSMDSNAVSAITAPVKRARAGK